MKRKPKLRQKPAKYAKHATQVKQNIHTENAKDANKKTHKECKNVQSQEMQKCKK